MKCFRVENFLIHIGETLIIFTWLKYNRISIGISLRVDFLQIYRQHWHGIESRTSYKRLCFCLLFWKQRRKFVHRKCFIRMKWDWLWSISYVASSMVHIYKPLLWNCSNIPVHNSVECMIWKIWDAVRIGRNNFALSVGVYAMHSM